MGILDDLWSWLTTSPGTAAGGSAGGTPYLGPASPTGSTQTPPAVTAAPALGGPPVSQGLLAGLLGGQQPANPMSYFMPRQGLLGNSPLGMGLRGGLAGLAAGAGQGGLSGFGAGAMGGQQEEMQRRQNQMATLAAGQQYLQGQQGLVGGALNMQFALDRANIIRRRLGQPELTMADLINNPMLAASPAAAQTAMAVPNATTPAVGAMGVPIVPTMPGVNPGVAQAYGVPTTTGMGAADILKQYPEAINAPQDVQDQAAIAFYRKYGGRPWISSQPQGTPVDPVPPASMTDDQIRARLAPIMVRESGGQNIRNAQQNVPDAGKASGFYQFMPNSWQEAVQLAYPSAGEQGQQPTMAPSAQAQPTVATAVPSQPDAVEQAYQNQIHDALASWDLAKADEATTKLAEYQAAATQKAKETAAVGATTYGGQQAGYDRAIKIRDDYQANKTVQRYGVARPAADAFEQAYQARGTPGGSSDYALVEAALQVLNPDVAVAKPGTAEYATQLQTLPGQAAAMITKAFNDKTAIDPTAVEQLKQAVEQRMAINEKLITKVNSSFADRAKRDAPQVGPDYWNPEGYGAEPFQAAAASNINPNTKAPYAKNDVVTDSQGKRWIYSGSGDPTDKNNWKAYP